jgi:ATP-dependent DNA ligase
MRRFQAEREGLNLMSFPLPLDFPPMEARSAALPEEPGWLYEPKWDGFRCLAFRSGEAVDLRSKSGQALARYFPEMVRSLGRLPARRFVLDGELLVPKDGGFDFEELQLRLHPAASRVAKLAAAHPAVYAVFDLLADDRATLVERPLAERRPRLEAFHARLGAEELQLSPATTDRAKALRWLDDLGPALDGLVAKRLDLPYRPGARDGMVKWKRLRTADCVVGGFRYGKASDQVGSLLLGLYDEEGRLNHVGFTSTLPRTERPALTRRLEALRRPPGFDGRAPGGPSRWSTERSGQWEPLAPKLVVEVRYDHVTGGRFRHGATLLRWRPDKAARQCGMEQLSQAG